MCTFGSSFSSSTSRQTSMSTRPLGCSPRVERVEPYPFLTLAGKPLSSFLILLVTPRGLRQFSLTRLYLQLSWRLNSGFDPAISLTLKAWFAFGRVLFQTRIIRQERLEGPSSSSWYYFECSPRSGSQISSQCPPLRCPRP